MNALSFFPRAACTSPHLLTSTTRTRDFRPRFVGQGSWLLSMGGNLFPHGFWSFKAKPPAHIRPFLRMESRGWIHLKHLLSKPSSRSTTTCEAPNSETVVCRLLHTPLRDWLMNPQHLSRPLSSNPNSIKDGAHSAKENSFKDVGPIPPWPVRRFLSHSGAGSAWTGFFFSISPSARPPFEILPRPE